MSHRIKVGLFAAIWAFVALAALPGSVSAACSVGSPLGTATITVNIPQTATYKFWSRIKPADTNNNAFYIEVDGGNCHKVGDDSAVAPNVWTWINHGRTGTTNTVVQQSLSAGNHTLKLIGHEPNVAVDRVMLLEVSDSCVPSNTRTASSDPGDNCKPGASTAFPPSQPFSSPPPAELIKTPAGQLVSVAKPNTTITGDAVLDPSIATDENVIKNVAKVEYYVNGELYQTDDSAPFLLDTTKLPDGQYELKEKIYFKDGTTKESTAIVNIDNVSEAGQALLSKPRNKWLMAGFGVMGAVMLGLGGVLGYRFLRQRRIRFLHRGFDKL